MVEGWRNWAVLCGGGLSMLALHAAVVLGLHDRRPPASPDVLHIMVGSVLEDDSGTSRPVTLPDDWIDSRPGARARWYRFELRLPDGVGALNAVYLPTIAQNAAVYVNGQSVGDGGRFDAPIAHNWPRPLFFPVPPELIDAGHNEISIYLASEPAGTGLLGDFYFGPRDVLLEHYERRYTLKVTAPTAFVVVLVILGVLVASITFRRPRDTVYLWFAAILIGLAGYALAVLVVEIPVSTRTWDWLRVVSIGWVVFFITGFTHRFIGVRRPRTERAALAVLLAGNFIVALVPGEAYYQYAGGWWAGLCLAWGLYPCYALTRRVAVEPRTEGLLLLYSGISLIFFGGHDALMVAGVLPRLDGYLIHYASPVVALVFTWVLLSELIEARRAAEKLNRELEDRVRDKTAELEDYHRRLRESERARAVMQERERIMRDMHDGVGGHLAGALSLLERDPARTGRTVEILRQATEDLRLIISSLEPTGEVLGEVLGLLRPRLQRQLDAAGIDLRWEVWDTAPVRDLGPEKALQIMRIVQEAVTNTIKHAGAASVTIRCEDGNDDVLLEISDDGAGMEEGAAGGFGLPNMKTRAERIDALLVIRSAGAGMRIQLRLPVAGV